MQRICGTYVYVFKMVYYHSSFSFTLHLVYFPSVLSPLSPSQWQCIAKWLAYILTELIHCFVCSVLTDHYLYSKYAVASTNWFIAYRSVIGVQLLFSSCFKCISTTCLFDADMSLFEFLIDRATTIVHK